MSIVEVGCCGAYCKTCKAFKNDGCLGCKLGYTDGQRDIKKARCEMKVCCIGKSLNSCADCDQHTTCEILQCFYGKKGNKYKKYAEATRFIKENGYNRFLEMAGGWQNQYWKYK